MNEILDLLKRSLSEIQNLQIKVDNKESQGWEGCARRSVLKANLEKKINEIKAQLNTAVNGDGI